MQTTDRPLLIAASAPMDPSWLPSSTADIAHARLPQVLLGASAQLRALTRALSQVASPGLLIAAPEIFSARQSAGAIAAALEQTGQTGHANSADGDPMAALTHLRFGAPRFARVLKGARNVLVSAVEANGGVATTSRNPYAGNDTLPLPFRHVLLWPDAIAPRAIDDGPIISHDLEPVLMTADLRGLDLETTPHVSTEPSGAGGLQLQPAADFDVEAWLPPWHIGVSARRATDEKQPLRPAGGAGLSGSALLIPWNLSHSSSIVPDLLHKIAAYDLLRRQPLDVVVYPFNEGHGGLAIVNRIALRLQALPDQCAESRGRIYFARAGDDRAITEVQRRVQLAVVEAADPEWRWTARRLYALSVPIGLIEPPGHVAESSQDMLTLAIDAEQRLETHIRDEFGRRASRVFTPTPLALSDLIAAAASIERGARRPLPADSEIAAAAQSLARFMTTG